MNESMQVLAVPIRTSLVQQSGASEEALMITNR